ncbi:MAG TPA: hypothetical protein VNQ73_11220 [Ilumatobacter sp.]|nr:hypothetical protein [Ilumatobacter sp.]
MTEPMAAKRLAAACYDLGAQGAFRVPDGYPDSLALCILDSIWSIGIRYTTVGKVVDRWRADVRATGLDPDVRGARDLARDIDRVGGPHAFAQQIGTMHRTSTRNGVLKAEAVHAAALAVACEGVDSTEELRSRADDPALRSAWCDIRGQGSGISWHYLLILAGVQDVKPDRMIMRFVNRALEPDPARSAEVVRGVLIETLQVLQADHPELTLRALDHTIWSFESNRAKSRR